METTDGSEGQSVLDKDTWEVKRMKYIILLGSEVTDEYDEKSEALQMYHEYVADEGDYHDFTLCEVMETHEAPKQEHIPYKRHYGVDYSKYDYPE